MLFFEILNSSNEFQIYNNEKLNRVIVVIRTLKDCNPRTNGKLWHQWLPGPIVYDTMNTLKWWKYDPKKFISKFSNRQYLMLSELWEVFFIHSVFAFQGPITKIDQCLQFQSLNFKVRTHQNLLKENENCMKNIYCFSKVVYQYSLLSSF